MGRREGFEPERVIFQISNLLRDLEYLSPAKPGARGHAVPA